MDSRYTYIFFDLDGTLLDSGEGVIDAIVYALQQFGVEPGERSRMRKLVGPAVRDSLCRVYQFKEEDAKQGVLYFQEAYEKDGIYRVPPFAGVEKMLQDLQDAGKILMVVTAKPQETAARVLHYTGIDHYFHEIVGPDRSEKKMGKEVLIRQALRSLGNPDPGRAVMVGDRLYDIEGAVRAGIDSIGVLYGYGDQEELSAAGATWFADTPEEVVSIISASGSPAE